VTLANQLDDFALRIDCNQLFGMLHNSRGDYHGAARFFEGNITDLAAAARPGRFASYYAVHARTWLAWVLSHLGQFDRAVALAEEAFAVAEASNDVHNLVAACWGRGVAELGRGAVERALPILRQAYDAAQSAEMTLWARPTAALLGRAYALAGNIADGRRLLESAIKGGENNVGVAAWHTYLAESCVLGGDLDAAEAVIAPALALAEKRRERGFLGHALRVAGDIAWRRGRFALSRERYEEAITLGSEREMRPLLAHCELGLAEVCRGLHDAIGADKHRAAARLLFEDMGLSMPDEPLQRR
jgi:tetratricopeptide (TPR) repeat protein